MNKRDKLLAWITRTGTVSELQILGSGMQRQLNDLRRAGIVKMIDDPQVKNARAAVLQTPK
jgi:hypothetical protein